MTHTPGPWRQWSDDIVVKDRDGDDMVICGIGKPAVLRSSPYSTPSRAQSKANARLIAAAPDMLEALENIILCCDANDSASLANAVADALVIVAKIKEP